MVDIKYKQYIIIPRGMSPGKMASQAVHASFMALENQRDNFDGFSGELAIENWKDNGQCVIVLEAMDQTHLMAIERYLQQWSVPYHCYYDEGLTEVAPLTPTALATGVLEEKDWWMFEKFDLYREKQTDDLFLQSVKKIFRKN